MRKNEKTFWKLIATGFGLGYVPRAPGTAGALGALVCAILILRFTANPYLWIGIALLVFTAAGIIAANKLEDRWGKDPSRIVIDEVAGMWVSLMWIGKGWIPLLLAFLLFRFFDIVKPLGIRRTEQLPGGVGVMADDILSGIYANVVLQMMIRFIPALR